MDSVIINQGETPPTNTPPVDSGGDGRPENVPEKFWDAENKAVKTDDLMKSYLELEKKFSSAAHNTPPPMGDPTPPPAGGDGDKLNIPEKPTKAPISDEAFQTYVEEYQQNGGLSEASYEALTKAGIPKAVVDQYIAGQIAIAEKMVSEVFTAVGGEEKYQAITKWASSNWSQEQQNAYNKAINSNDPAVRNLALEGLKSAYSQANPAEPNLIGGADRSTGVQGFKSTAELTTAMRDPRYENDPAYRQEVASKLAVSNIF